MNSVAYRLTSPKGKQYIGITKRTAQQRFSEHIRRAASDRPCVVQHAINMYGSEAFKIEVLVQADWEYLLELEPKLIRLYGTKAPGGYNVASGGAQCDANKGRKLSPEWRKKMSDAQTARWSKINKEDRSAIAKKAHQNSDPERGARHSNRMRELHEDPIWRAEWLRKLREGKKK